MIILNDIKSNVFYSLYLDFHFAFAIFHDINFMPAGQLLKLYLIKCIYLFIMPYM